MLPCNFSILSKRFSMENHFFQSQTSQTKLTLPGNFHSGFVLAFMYVYVSPAWLTFVPSTYRACLRAWNELPGVPEAVRTKNFLILSLLFYQSAHRITRC
jgi:hypothetical protein